MDRGTPDLFGHVPSSKPTKTRTVKASVSSPVAESYFVVYAPGWKPISFLAGAVVAFVSWYVFGAQLVDLPSIEAKDLPEPLYGALIFVWLIVGAIWVSTDFAQASFSYAQANPDRRIFGRYRSRFKAWSFRTTISIGCMFFVFWSSLLVLHGYWNARSVAIVVIAKLLQPPKLSEERVAESPILPTAPPPRLEPFGPPAPLRKLAPPAPPIETGSISAAPAKKWQKTPSVKEVDPLSKSIKEICDWFERTFGSPTK
jgi:hypothetical protein